MSTSDTTVARPPVGFGAKVKQVGPGLLAAAAGVGAGDLVATMVAGARFGTVLLWAAVLGAVLKLALAEGVGRWHLASGSTLLDGWRRLGRWATVFFGVYIVIWGFVYGATAMSAVGLPLNALFGGLDVRYWAMIAGVVGLVLVWLQRYEIFEKFITVLVLIKFVSVVSVAFLVAPDLLDLAGGLVPRLPDGSVIYVLGLIGGVGGTITMAAYGYWMIAKGWKGTGWLSMMRLDNAVGYTMTAIFVIAMLVVGANLLLGQDLTENDRGLLVLGTELGTRYGDWARILFLVGFLAVTTTSLLGVWNGVSLLFTDWTRAIRLPHGAAAEVAAEALRTERSTATETGYEARAAERSTPFRAYLIWLTIPPMALLFFDRPFALTLIYGVLGAAFMPFLGVTLILLLNSKRIAADGRSGWLSNGLLGLASALFVVLLVADIWNRVS
ncbi:Nramp family divalent metal transporter [Pseudonocardia sp. DSM 110487]|uniref:Nramp family divalent metal transporter n=1 Tax=Pseudonocardia sp. DSM 110487 TaxID=2865833 RepID=UPI001C6A6B6A|nr:Nramp family divalent metal transporter [Pseudonocardia sp. DSM 110487]QYN34378.1 Nramp family divalent metal transporter [Pseudonocardia sp. DSM 110487]